MKKPIYERILREAEDDVKALLSEAKREAETLIKAGKAAIIDQNTNELETVNDLSKRRVKAFNERQEKGLSTYQEQARQKLVVSVFSEVSTKLAALRGSELLAFVAHLIKTEKVSGDEVMQVSKRNAAKYTEALGKNLEHLNAKDQKYKFSLSNEPTHIKEGFLLAGKKYDLMFDFDEIITEYQKQHEQRIYHELFNHD